MTVAATGPLTLWSGTVRGATFAERLDAAVAGGFSAVSMFPTDYREALSAGLTPADMRSMMDDRGVRVAALDPYSRWLPDWRPPDGVSAQNLALLDMDERELLTAAESLGVEAVSVVEPFGVVRPLDLLVEAFAAVCDRAAESGLRVQLEFIPFTGIKTLAAAWDIVRLADRPNGGIVFDVWHFLRGDPDEALLRRIPGDRIFAVQVCDGRSEPMESPVQDALRHRLLPGEGDWDVTGLVRLLRRRPETAVFGIEVFSEELWALPAAEIGRVAGASLRRVLCEAWGDAPAGAAPPG